MTFWQIWWLALAIKVAILPFLPITPDETYYLMWAKHTALSYFDHPPMIAWLMTLALPFWKTFIGIRLPGVVLSHVGFLPWFSILKRLSFSRQAISLWTVGLLVGPLTGLGAFIITPDVPLVFFWSLSLLTLLWTIENPTSSRWALLGVVFGLGMLSKYVMVIFVPTMLLWFLWEQKLKLLLKPGPWIALFISVLVFSPVLIWNYQHEFASFSFQTKHGLSTGNSFHWSWPLEYLSSQFGLLNPLVVIIGGVVIFKYSKENKLLTVFSLFPLAFFFLTSFRAQVEANWPVVAYPCFMALAAVSIDIFKNDLKQLAQVKLWLRSSFALCLLFITVVISHTIHPWLPINRDRDHTLITREWSEDIAIVNRYRPLFARSYQMASYLSYFRASEDEVFKYKGLDRKDVYDFLKASEPVLLKNEKAYIIMKADDPVPVDMSDKYLRQSLMILPSRMVLYELTGK
jgi:4-amino-4-deoxy-L-arabinose transferase-like glycosyltransferase